MAAGTSTSVSGWAFAARAIVQSAPSVDAFFSTRAPRSSGPGLPPSTMALTPTRSVEAACSTSWRLWWMAQPRTLSTSHATRHHSSGASSSATSTATSGTVP